MNKKRDLKREFEEFSQKVTTLRLLKEELDALDARGFESEAGTIRIKLKNVDAISEIKEELEELRRKIAKRDAKKLISASESVPVSVMKETGSLNRKFSNLKSAFDKHAVIAESSLKRKINELENIINSKRKVASKKQLSKEEVDYVKDVPNLIREIQALKHTLSENAKNSHNILKEKIKALEEILQKKRRVSSKKQLSKEEVDYVKDVPDVEKSLGSLREELKKHLEKSGEIHKEIPRLEGRFLEFRREFEKSNKSLQNSLQERIALFQDLIEKKRILASKKQLTNDEVKAVKEIPVLESKLEMLKEELGKETKSSYKSLQGKIDELDDLIEKKRILASKKQLSKEDVSYVKDIPVLEKQFNELKNLLRRHDEKTQMYEQGIENLDSELKELKEAFEKHSKSFRIPVDAGVGIVVDKGFGEFLESLKSKLSQEVEAKKASVQKKLTKNLALQEKEFTKKYNELAREMHREYESKVKEELQKEVERRFNEQLQEKIADEKGKIIEKISRQKAEELEAEKKELIAHLELLYSQRQKELEEMSEKEIEDKKGELLRKERALQEKFDREREEKGKEISQRERELQERFENAEKEEKSLIEEEMQAIEKQKNNLRNELEKRVVEEQKKLDSQLNEIRNNLEADYKRKIKETEERGEQERKSIDEKERKFRMELENQYNKKLAEAIQAEKARIESEKKSFEEHVIAQARKLFRE